MNKGVTLLFRRPLWEFLTAAVGPIDLSNYLHIINNFLENSRKKAD